MTVWNDGSGNALYVGGNFVIAGGQTVNRIAKWDGHTWSPLGTGMYASGPAVAATVQALAVYDDGHGGGPALYAAGTFANAGGVPANRVAKWDGTSWSAVGDGITGSGAIVWALTVYDDGTGSALYAAGRFTQAGGNTANRIAKWDGASWSAVGASTMDQEAYGLTVYNDGSGPALYVAGAFTTPGTHIAKWNGSAWSALGTGTTTPAGNDPSRGFSQTLIGFSGGLIDGGRFFRAGGITVNNIARWSAGAWSAMGGGIKTSNDDDVIALAVGDIGATGSQSLYAGGIFSAAGTGGAVSAANIVRWNGSAWSALGSGTNSDVYTMAVYDSGDGNGPALYVGGVFTSAGGVPVNHIARWGCNPSGACCLPSGACDVRTNQACLTAVGTYSGNGATCAGSPACTPAPTGACCSTAGCSVVWNLGEGGCNAQRGIYRGDSSACASAACPHFEAEPNNSRTEATPVTLANGDAIAGITTGSDTTAGNSASSTADMFRVQTAAAAPGIYLHTLTLHNDATPGNAGLLAVRIENADSPCPAATDFTDFFPYAVGQEAMQSGDDRVSAWYGFGRQERVYYQVTGVAPTPTDPGTSGVYTATLQSSPVTPTDLGTFAAGPITITTTGQGHANDTAVAVYDSSFTLIPNFTNDNASASGGAPADDSTSFLRRTYAPGTYYLAVGISYLAASSTLGVPCDDSQALQVFNDFPDLLLPADSVTGSVITDVSFSISDGQTTLPVPAARASTVTAAWYRFTVGGQGVCCRGATCNTTVSQAGCTTTGGAAGASFAPSASACNPGPTSNSPCCYADYNKIGGVNIQDIFDYLADWFGGAPYANTGGNGSAGTLTVQNIFDFLASWFAGGC